MSDVTITLTLSVLIVLLLLAMMGGLILGVYLTRPYRS